MMLYHHILDLGDSIDTLFRFGSLSARSILKMALFESWLAPEFVLEENSFHRISFLIISKGETYEHNTFTHGFSAR
jgi:hypothetical protein